MWCRVVATALVALLVAGGCTSGGDAAVEDATSTTAVSTTVEKTSSTTTSTSSTTAPTPTTTLPSAEVSIDWEYTNPADLPVVALLDAGQEPRSERSYTAEVGASRTTMMRFSTAIEQSIDEEESTNIETVAMVELTSTVVAVDQTGITIEETYGPGSVEATDPLTASVTEAAYAQLEGVTTYTLMSPRGEVLALSTADLPPDLAEMTQGIATAAVPLPVEPIGVGAVWEAVSTVESVGVTFIQTTRTRLTEINDSLLTLEMATNQTLGPDGFAIPGVETINADFASTGSGTAIWDLEGPFPVEAFSTADQTLVAVLAIDGERATLDQTVAFTMELQPADPAESAATATDRRLVAEGKLTVCTETPYKPFEWKDPTTSSGYTGFDIELIGAIAQEMELDLAIVDTAFDGIWLQPAAGTCDVVASAMTITSDRAEHALFSDPYFNNALSLMVTAANDGLTLAGTDGMRIGVQTETAGELYATANKPAGADLVSFNDEAALFLALESGSVDAILHELPVNGYRATQDPDFVITELYETDDWYGFGMALDNEGLATQINDTLNELKDSGAYDNLHLKYFAIRSA